MSESLFDIKLILTNIFKHDGFIQKTVIIFELVRIYLEKKGIEFNPNSRMNESSPFSNGISSYVFSKSHAL